MQTYVGYSTCADSFSQLTRIYHEALTALNIRRTFFEERDTIAYDRLGIGRLIAELPADLCNAFLYEVFGTRLPDDLDEETQNTIQKFYENNLNISETARQLYLHRNTLVYRLERLEKTLGLDIRKFEDAMTFKLAMMVLAHVREQKHDRMRTFGLMCGTFITLCIIWSCYGNLLCRVVLNRNRCCLACNLYGTFFCASFQNNICVYCCFYFCLYHCHRLCTCRCCFHRYWYLCF